MGLLMESCVSELLLVITGILTAFYYYCTSTRDFWKKKGIAYVQPNHFLGNMVPFITGTKSLGECHKDIYYSKEAKGQPYVGFWSGRKPLLLAIDPDFIKQVLIKDFQTFSDRGINFNEKLEPLNAHLFNLGGWQWRVLRTQLTPTFTSGKMKYMFGTMLECSETLEKLLANSTGNGNIIEIKEPLAKFTTDTIGSCAFGLQINSIENENNEFRNIGRSIFEPSFWTALIVFIRSALPFLVNYLRVTIVSKKASKFFTQVVSDTVKHRKENNVTRNDMMQLLIEIQKKGAIVDEEDKYTSVRNVPTNKEGHQVFELTDSLLAAQAFVFFLAGFETSSTTMGFALYELAKNMDIQKKLKNEIRDTLKRHNGVISYDALQDMKYLDMVISETLRKFPPVPQLTRRVTRPYKMADTEAVLPVGVTVTIPVYALHNDPKYFPNPESFIPERFSPENKPKINSSVYLPFGEGPKNCIGARFGQLQTKLGLVTVLKKYTLNVCEKTPQDTVLEPRSLVTALKGGIYLRITPDQ